ncbi:MAG: uracil-DNA glycosylase [Anaerolineae bacterium]|jgi:DNA polymerase|nr:uracil-DNA glycosylase [Anaerolineae bacterium]
MSEDRAARLAAIAEQVKHCKLCRLHEKALNGVPGSGNVQAEILFIGEAPGEQEDKQGLPFVGRSGQYLDYLLNLIQIKRDQVFIANVAKHRPPENRDPLPDEIAACKPYLDQQIEIIDPLMIVTLGRFSMARYFPTGKITALHGKPRYDDRRAYYPLFHPAAALRTPALRIDMEADIKRIPEILEEVKKLRQARSTPPTLPPAQNDNDGTPPQQPKLF